MKRKAGTGNLTQKTDAFRENYAIRAGGESTNSGLKRKTGLGRVRTRGRPRVSLAVILRCAGWNVFRALTTLKKRGIRDFAAFAESFWRRLAGLRSFDSATRHRYAAKIVFYALPPNIPPRPPLSRHLAAA